MKLRKLSRDELLTTFGLSLSLPVGTEIEPVLTFPNIQGGKDAEFVLIHGPGTL